MERGTRRYEREGDKELLQTRNNDIEIEVSSTSCPIAQESRFRGSGYK